MRTVNSSSGISIGNLCSVSAILLPSQNNMFTVSSSPIHHTCDTLLRWWTLQAMVHLNFIAVTSIHCARPSSEEITIQADLILLCIIIIWSLRHFASLHSFSFHLILPLTPSRTFHYFFLKFLYYYNVFNIKNLFVLCSTLPSLWMSPFHRWSRWWVRGAVQVQAP